MGNRDGAGNQLPVLVVLVAQEILRNHRIDATLRFAVEIRLRTQLPCDIPDVVKTAVIVGVPLGRRRQANTHRV